MLNSGIEPLFYQSEYNQYYEDAMFPNPRLEAFAPDIIFIHTSNRNISVYPGADDTPEHAEELLQDQVGRFTAMWDRLFDIYKCPIIQNNMELPILRLLGNQDGVDLRGRTAFIRRINQAFADYAASHENFYIHDLEYAASAYGLDQFSDPFYWYMYKYCLCVPAIPAFAFSLSNIMRSIWGKNKKGLVLDLDNTLWGGVIGDDGPEGIELGQESSMGQAYIEFQEYLKSLQQMGILLAVNSKNDKENALLGLNHPNAALTPDDFQVIKANWEPKDANLQAIADELGILPESLVFVDDNPVERFLIQKHIPDVLAPDIGSIEHYAMTLDHAGYFEITTLSDDDRNRNKMYRQNKVREQMKASYDSYPEYLRSLNMTAVIKPFEDFCLPRITQLTNKSNQFNLTTRRYTQTEIEGLSRDQNTITLYGRLEDCFGDNGIVSVIIGHREQETQLHLDLWLMSCRVLKRDMECAMMDVLVQTCQEQGIRDIFGYYYQTPKNGMVRHFFEERGFSLLEEKENGDSRWHFHIPKEYMHQNNVIKIVRETL